MTRLMFGDIYKIIRVILTLCWSVRQISFQHLTPDCLTLNFSERPVMEWVKKQAKFLHRFQSVGRRILTEKVEQIPPVLNFMTQWKNSDHRSVSLTPFLPYSNLNIFIVFDKIIRIIFWIMSKNVEWDGNLFSSFSFHLHVVCKLLHLLLVANNLFCINWQPFLVTY